MVQVKWRNSLGSITYSSQLCMLFIAIYLAIQTEYIFLPTFRFEAGKTRVSVCLCAAVPWGLRLCLCGGFLIFFQGKKLLGLVWLCACQRSHFSLTLQSVKQRSHFIASTVALGSRLLVLSSAFPLELFSDELWASKGTLTEAHVALRVREGLLPLLLQCFPTYYRHAPLPPLALAD